MRGLDDHRNALIVDCSERYAVQNDPAARSGPGRLVALLEQILPPRMLAAPMHRHSREDEYSIVLKGQLGVFHDDEVVNAPSWATQG